MVSRNGLLLIAAALTGFGLTAAAEAQQAAMSFFVTSAGKGNGADLGGLEGADAHCIALAKAAGSTNTNWHAYLSTTAPAGGSDPEGLYSTAGGDTTCGNWTKSGDGSAIVGHHDRTGLKDTRHMNSWNSSHGSRGCGQDALKATGGAGLLYCFAAN
jgi:hypothetical protein